MKYFRITFQILLHFHIIRLNFITDCTLIYRFDPFVIHTLQFAESLKHIFCCYIEKTKPSVKNYYRTQMITI